MIRLCFNMKTFGLGFILLAAFVQAQAAAVDAKSPRKPAQSRVAEIDANHWQEVGDVVISFKSGPLVRVFWDTEKVQAQRNSPEGVVSSVTIPRAAPCQKKQLDAFLRELLIAVETARTEGLGPRDKVMAVRRASSADLFVQGEEFGKRWAIWAQPSTRPLFSVFESLQSIERQQHKPCTGAEKL